MMHMTFYWSKNLTLLFSSWKTDSWMSYTLTLLDCFLFSVFYQYMEDRRLRFKSIALANAKSKPTSGSIDVPLLFQQFNANNWANSARVSVAILFGVNSAIGHLLMLAIMSSNGGVFVVIVLGLSFGFLVFRGGDEEVVGVENPCACA